MNDDTPDAGHDPAEPATLPLVRAGAKPERDRPLPLVDGILDQGDMTVLGAARAVGKSWWGMDLALKLAQGYGNFMGHFTVHRSARVLYCHGELDDWGAFDRWAKLTGGIDPPDGLLETFEGWQIRVSNRRVYTTPQITDEVTVAVLDGRLEATIAAQRIEVLIIDPWAVFYGGRENSNDEAEAALRTLRDLQLRYGLAVVILHHFGKGDSAREPEDLWRGASRLADWAATRITLQAHYTPQQAAAQHMTRHQARQYADVKFLRRRYAPPNDFTVKLDLDTGQWKPWRDPNPPMPGGRTEVSITDLVQKCPKEGWVSVIKAAAALGLAEGTARRMLEQAVMQGFLEEFRGPNRSRGFRPRTVRNESATESATQSAIPGVADPETGPEQG